MELSIVIPAYNEEESLPELMKRISANVDSLEIAYEVIFVDDGSTDSTPQVIESLKEIYPQIRAIFFRRNYGKSPALSEGFKMAEGAKVLTMDADLQDDPAEIPALMQMIDDGYDMVSGWKKTRHDPISKTLPSKFFNKVTAALSGIHIHDFNCGLKIYRNEVVKSMAVYGELHRYLPVLAHYNGFKVGEMVVQHHARQHGHSKFGFTRIFPGFFDLFTVLFLTRFRTRPLHVFGIPGVLSFLSGFSIELYLTMRWFAGKGIGGRPLFFLGILLILVGIQFFGFGLLAEMISANQAKDVQYGIRKRIE